MGGIPCDTCNMKTLAFLLLILQNFSVGLVFNLPRAASSLDGSNPELCPSLPGPDLDSTQLLTELNTNLVQTEMQISAALKKDNSPGGAALCLVYEDKVIWSKGFGLANMSDTARGPPDENTGFRIGSITKVLTSLITLMARDRGLIESLDMDVNSYLPYFSVINPFQTLRSVTFRQLMSHMSGLPRNTPCKGIFDTGCNISDAEIYKNIAEMRLQSPPGKQPSYSNLGFGLLGQALLRITKFATWDEMVREMVFDPLAMTNSGSKFGPQDIAKMAVGYYPDGSVAEFIDIGWDAAAGQSYSTTADLAKLMMLIFKTNISALTQMVDGETLVEWMQPAYVYPDGTGYGYPWELRPVDNFVLRTKDGGINGYNTEFQMAPEIKTGFVFLQSCDGCSSHREIISLAQQLLVKTGQILTDHRTPPSLPPNPKDYVGIFNATVENVVNITLQTLPTGHQALFIGKGGGTALLEWRMDDAFQITVRGLPAVACSVLSTGIGYWVYFQRSPATGEGDVVSLTIPGAAYETVYTKSP